MLYLFEPVYAQPSLPYLYLPIPAAYSERVMSHYALHIPYSAFLYKSTFLIKNLFLLACDHRFNDSNVM